MDKNIVDKIDDLVKINTILVSVSDKSGLGEFISGIVDINPKIRILSTGGTYLAIKEILANRTTNVCDCNTNVEDRDKILEQVWLEQVSDYTGQPETQGGLVKTLDFKIYLGVLTETYNESHQNDLKRTGAIAIDMVVVNLYPFKETISKSDVTCEKARGNIDIGGPTMIRASAKNFIRVASVVDPFDYPTILSDMRQFNGALSLEKRFTLAKKAFDHTALYDRTIADYLNSIEFELVKGCYSSPT
ncbi:MAG: hypothetical protein HQK72_04975 [Desulfamplus sp.]|nr:hypothetical protein [Desulfamplus sp.]